MVFWGNRVQSVIMIIAMLPDRKLSSARSFFIGIYLEKASVRDIARSGKAITEKVAASAPKKPAFCQPTNVAALSAIGPGVD